MNNHVWLEAPKRYPSGPNELKDFDFFCCWPNQFGCMDSYFFFAFACPGFSIKNEISQSNSLTIHAISSSYCFFIFVFPSTSHNALQINSITMLWKDFANIPLIWPLNHESAEIPAIGENSSQIYWTSCIILQKNEQFFLVQTNRPINLFEQMIENAAPPHICHDGVQLEAGESSARGTQSVT